MGSASEGVMSHRNFNPAQEADTLEPKRHRSRRRQPKPLTGLHCHAPGGEHRPTDATMETGNGVTPPRALGEAGPLTEEVPTGCAGGGGCPKKPTPGVMPWIC